MDLFMTARYYDLLTFQDYDFAAQDWGATFQGQLKRADQFLTIYHRPTRKRMLYTDGVEKPSSPVIRVVTTGEIFMVGALQEDSHDNVHYRNIYAMTKPNGEARVYRKAPVGPPDDPGWAVRTLVETTWADVELRSLNENEEEALIHHGHVIMTFPQNCQIEPLDTVELDGPLGQTYYALERYIDSSYVNVRAVARGDELKDFVYHRWTGQTYANQQVTQTYQDYNVTGRVGDVSETERNGSITGSPIKIFIKADWIGFPPDLKDQITYAGGLYKVSKITRDPLTEQWQIIASV